MTTNENPEGRPTRSQIETLLSDWLEGSRDAGTFVHKNTDGAISRTAVENEALSQYARGNLSRIDPVDLMRCAREIAQGVVNTMTDTPVKVTVGGQDSYTDGRAIHVATNHFDDEALTPGEKIDILTGFSVHEACHIMHTDFTMKRTDDATSGGSSVARLRHDIDNILEDERIEHLLGESQDRGGDGMPGLADYLAKSKKRAFGSYKAEAGKDLPTEPIPRFINALIGAVRFPAMLTEEMVESCFPQLDAARKILRPFPKTQRGVFEATDRILEVMKDMLQQQQNADGKKPKKDSSSSKESGGNRQNGDDALSKALSTKQSEAVMSAMEAASSVSDGTSGKNESAVLKNGDSVTADYVNGEAEKDCACGAGGKNVITYIKKAASKRSQYDKSLSRVRRYVPAMAKALRCKTLEREYILQGEQSGKLNTNKLVTYKTGNHSIFTKKGASVSDSACVCLLIDESGSMSGSREEATRDAAVLINEAVKHIPSLQLFVYGFTGNSEGVVKIYAENEKREKWTLGDTSSRGGTPTAEAMRIAMDRIRKRTDDKCLMLILTDGQPNDVSATREQDELSAKKNFVTVAIDLMGGTMVDRVFRKSITTSDMQTLAPAIAAIVKKQLSGTLARHDVAC